MLLGEVQIGEGDSAEAARQKLIARMKPLFAKEGEAPIHLIGHLIGLDFSASPHVQELLGDELVFKERAFDACLLCLRRLGELRPVVVVLDDLHWADAQTLSFMRRLLEANRDTPLLSLIMTRPTIFSPEPTRKKLAPTSRFPSRVSVTLIGSGGRPRATRSFCRCSDRSTSRGSSARRVPGATRCCLPALALQVPLCDLEEHARGGRYATAAGMYRIGRSWRRRVGVEHLNELLRRGPFLKSLIFFRGRSGSGLRSKTST